VVFYLTQRPNLTFAQGRPAFAAPTIQPASFSRGTIIYLADHSAISIVHSIATVVQPIQRFLISDEIDESPYKYQPQMAKPSELHHKK
jgi:hypothetical protein